jgi:hypothetical protein
MTAPNKTKHFFILIPWLICVSGGDVALFSKGRQELFYAKFQEKNLACAAGGRRG